MCLLYLWILNKICILDVFRKVKKDSWALRPKQGLINNLTGFLTPYLANVIRWFQMHGGWLRAGVTTKLEGPALGSGASDENRQLAFGFMEARGSV